MWEINLARNPEFLDRVHFLPIIPWLRIPPLGRVWLMDKKNGTCHPTCVFIRPNLATCYFSFDSLPLLSLGPVKLYRQAEQYHPSPANCTFALYPIVSLLGTLKLLGGVKRAKYHLRPLPKNIKLTVEKGDMSLSWNGTQKPVLRRRIWPVAREDGLTPAVATCMFINLTL